MTGTCTKCDGTGHRSEWALDYKGGVSGHQGRWYHSICPDLDRSPLVFWIGEVGIEHGERDDMDSVHPQACLCGFANYIMCPYQDKGVRSLTILRGTTEEEQ